MDQSLYEGTRAYYMTALRHACFRLRMALLEVMQGCAAWEPPPSEKPLDLANERASVDFYAGKIDALDIAYVVAFRPLFDNRIAPMASIG